MSIIKESLLLGLSKLKELIKAPYSTKIRTSLKATTCTNFVCQRRRKKKNEIKKAAELVAYRSLKLSKLSLVCEETFLARILIKNSLGVSRHTELMCLSKETLLKPNRKNLFEI